MTFDWYTFIQMAPLCYFLDDPLHVVVSASCLFRGTSTSGLTGKFDFVH